MVVTLSVDPTPSSPGLVLRPWSPEDVEALLAAHRDPLLQTWLATHLDGEDQARRWIVDQGAGWSAGTRFSFAVLECGDGRTGAGPPIGHVALKRGSRPQDPAEVGYWTSAGARGRGVAPRALDAVSRWALGPRTGMRLDRLHLIHASGNAASCRVAEKSGYGLDSVLPPYPPAFRTEGHLHVRTAADGVRRSGCGPGRRGTSGGSGATP
ncbi:GNAT family N-acetyltransferase [Streptomyces sp. NPDC093225]|uniref:GNAT family N-acetyltransferase n=1 Tax=Streptomyces sp. NPDC093225 TaxID=3366034 RepID=UPI0037F2F44E